MCPLKYLATEVVWSGVVFSATQMQLNDHRNIIGIQQAAVLLRNYMLLLVTLTMKLKQQNI